MKKIIFITVVILLIIISVQIIILKTYKIPSKSRNVTPIPTMSGIKITIDPNQKNLFVMATQHINKAVNTPLNQKIVITFNTTVKQNEINFEIDPNIAYAIQTNKNIVTIIPQNNLAPSTIYFCKISHKSGVFQRLFYFTTIGPTPTPVTDTFPTGAAKQEEDFLKTNYPDVFLSNKTPFQTSDFSISSDFKTTPTGHFYFIINLKGDKEKAKINFINWLKSLGLIDVQINNLEISYH